MKQHGNCFLLWRQGALSSTLSDIKEWVQASQVKHSDTCSWCSTPRASPKHVGTSGRWIIWHLWTPIFFKLFQPMTGLDESLWVHAHIADNFQENSFVCGNLGLPAQYFWLFQWCLSAPCRLTPQPPAP